MKKFLMIAFLAAYSHISNAQNANEIVSSNIDTTPVAVKTTSVEERLNKQEQEIKALKKDSEILRNEMNKLKSSLPNAKRKFTVVRAGSKQLITE